MSKILRYSLFTIFALLCAGGVQADDLSGRTPEVTLDFTGDTDNWNIGTTKTVDEKSFTYNGYTIKLKGTTGNGYRWYNDGYVLNGKEGATLTLPAFDFDVDYITIVGRTGASSATKQNIFVGETAVSTETTGATGTNTYAIASDYQATGNVYVIKVTSAHNTQFTKINIYKKSSTVDTRASTAIAFADGYATTGIQETSIALPTATVTTDDGTTTVSDAAITWTSSDPTIAAIDGNNLNLLKYGKVTITATYAGDDTAYKGSSKDYEVTVKGTIEDGVFNFGMYQDYGSELDFYTASVKEATWTAGNITMTTVGRSAWLESDGSFRLYAASGNSAVGAITFTAPTGKVITSIAFTGSGTAMTASIGTLSEGTWTGSANSVTFTRGGANAVIKTITVTYEETTGIGNIKADVNSDKNAPVYNLAGQRVSESYKGIVIVNGKKVKK